MQSPRCAADASSLPHAATVAPANAATTSCCSADRDPSRVWLPTTALAVRESHLTAAPRAVVGGQEISLGAATYRVGSPPSDAGARAARVDHSGRLLIDGGADLAAKLAHGVAVVYVQKVLR